MSIDFGDPISAREYPNNRTLGPSLGFLSPQPVPRTSDSQRFIECQINLWNDLALQYNPLSYPYATPKMEVRREAPHKFKLLFQH